MKNNSLGWLLLFDCLSEEGKKKARVRVLDTIVFDPMNSLRPLFWAYTSETGEICKLNLRDWAIAEIIDNVLHAYNSNSTLIIIHTNGNRKTVIDPTHKNIICPTLHALQIFNKNFQLFPNLFVHEFSISNEKNCYEIVNEEEVLVPFTNPVNFRIRAMTGLVILKLQELSRYNIISVKVLYYIDKKSFDPWLAGFSDCCAHKIFELENRFEIAKDIRIRTSLIKKHINLNTSLKVLNQGTPIIRGKHFLSNSKGFLNPKVENSGLSKTFYDVRKEISNTLNPSLDYLSGLPGCNDFYGSPCRGQFCKLEMIRISKYDKSLRCLIPLYLIELANKSEYSPFINPSLRKIPNDFYQLGCSSSSVNTELYKKKVPVCLRCYIVYSNIKYKKMKKH